MIGIVMSVAPDPARNQVFVGTTYLNAVEMAGGVPLPLSPVANRRTREHFFKRINGILLIGGGDVDPARYGGKKHPKTGGISKIRDEFEIHLVKHAVKTRLPLLAICRGIQVLNVALGGTLIQDIPSQVKDPFVHSPAGPGKKLRHEVCVLDPGSLLASVLGTTKLTTNSYHHQAVRKAGRGLVVSALSPDWVVEGIEPAKRGPFLLGVQWHPELLVKDNQYARRLFKALVSASAKRKSAQS
jgi:putative glutamine amidotransferase